MGEQRVCRAVSRCALLYSFRGYGAIMRLVHRSSDPAWPSECSSASFLEAPPDKPVFGSRRGECDRGSISSGARRRMRGGRAAPAFTRVAALGAGLPGQREPSAD